MEITTLTPQVLESYVDAPVAPAVKERRRPMFTGNEDHDITMAEASRLTRNYRERAGKNAIKGGFFGQAALQQLMDQDGVVGVRYYYAQENDGRPVLVLVGVGMGLSNTPLVIAPGMSFNTMFVYQLILGLGETYADEAHLAHLIGGDLGQHAEGHHGGQADAAIGRMAVDVLEAVERVVGDRHQLDHALARMGRHARRLVERGPATVVGRQIAGQALETAGDALCGDDAGDVAGREEGGHGCLQNRVQQLHDDSSSPPRQPLADRTLRFRQ